MRLLRHETGHAIENAYLLRRRSRRQELFGKSHEPLIHLVLASFRSIETRRALIRSTNTGISAFVDPVGRLTHRTGQWTQEILVAPVAMIEDGSSTIYMLVGDVYGWAALALVALGLVRSRRRPVVASTPSESEMPASPARPAKTARSKRA